MLGVDLAAQVVQRLLSPSGGMLLEVCRALWMLQGLLEQSKYETFRSTDTRFLAEHERLESELDARLSVAGTGMSEAVALMNDRERHMFHHQANQQRQQVVNQTAWDFRQLLCLQQIVLSKLDVPGFEDGPTVDEETLQLQSYICQYLHSAFYIRNRMGSSPHESMLRAQLKKLLREQELQQNQQHQHGGLGSHSPKMNGTSSPAIRNSPVPPMTQQYGSVNGSAPMLPNVPSQPYSVYTQQQYQQPTPQLQPMMMMMMPNGMQPGPPQHYSSQQQYTMPGGGQMMYQPPPPMMMQQQQQFQQPPVYNMQQQQYQPNGQPHLLPNYGGIPPQSYPPYYQQ
jgi:hypothetical protein